MADQSFFQFLAPVLNLLPAEDKVRMGELWQGYEQVFGSVYQTFVEAQLNVSIRDLQPYATERWLPYKFDSSTQVLQSAVVTSTQDLSMGVNLSAGPLLCFSIDDGPQIEVDVSGSNPISTTIFEVISRINIAAGFNFARGIYQNSILQFASPTKGLGSKITFYATSRPDKNALEYVVGLVPSSSPHVFPKYPYIYAQPYSSVASIPYLQDHIRDESVTSKLTEGQDYILGNGTILFKAAPSAQMWAKRTLIDKETPWNNFGFLLKIYQPNSPAYVSVLQGLWYAYWTGATPTNVTSALYLLFGLPVAQESTTVTTVTSSTIVTTSAMGVVRTFQIPSGLAPIVTVGQQIDQFTPLVSGITVLDKINSPGFVTELVGRTGIQPFLTEDATRGSDPSTDESKALAILEENAFLPQIEVEAFNNPNISLASVLTFLSSIRPLSKTFLPQIIVGTFRDSTSFSEVLEVDSDIDVTPNIDANATTWLDSSDLLPYEGIDNPGLDLDSDTFLLSDQIEVAVFQGGAQVDSFIA